MRFNIALLFLAAAFQRFTLAEWNIRIGYGAEPIAVDFTARPGDGSTVYFHTEMTWPVHEREPQFILVNTHVEWNSQTQWVRGDGPYFLTRTRERFLLSDEVIPEIGFDLGVGAQFFRPNLHVTEDVYPRWRYTLSSDVNFHEITFTEPRQVSRDATSTRLKAYKKR